MTVPNTVEAAPAENTTIVTGRARRLRARRRNVALGSIVAGAAVFSGAALGSTTCLYGDGIILASRSIGIKPINLMLAILPYAGIAAGLSLVLYLVTGFVAA